MRLLNYQTGNDTFQDNMADPNAHQSSRVKQQRQKKRSWKEGKQRGISFMKQMYETIYERMVFTNSLHRNLLIKCNYLCTVYTEIQYAHDSVLLFT